MFLFMGLCPLPFRLQPRPPTIWFSTGDLLRALKPCAMPHAPSDTTASDPVVGCTSSLRAPSPLVVLRAAASRDIAPAHDAVTPGLPQLRVVIPSAMLRNGLGASVSPSASGARLVPSKPLASSWPTDAEQLNGSLTRGFPDPASIEEQKQAYAKSLDLQLEEGNRSLREQNEERKRELRRAAEQRKQALVLQVEQQVRAHEAVLDEQTNQALMSLKKAALEQRAALDQQAASLTLEYQQRKMQEEFIAAQAQMQKQYLESHARLQLEERSLQKTPRHDGALGPVALADAAGSLSLTCLPPPVVVAATPHVPSLMQRSAPRTGADGALSPSAARGSPVMLYWPPAATVPAAGAASRPAG